MGLNKTTEGTESAKLAEADNAIDTAFISAEINRADWDLLKGYVLDGYAQGEASEDHRDRVDALLDTVDAKIRSNVEAQIKQKLGIKPKQPDYIGD